MDKQEILFALLEKHFTEQGMIVNTSVEGFSDRMYVEKNGSGFFVSYTEYFDELIFNADNAVWIAPNTSYKEVIWSDNGSFTVSTKFSIDDKESLQRDVTACLQKVQKVIQPFFSGVYLTGDDIADKLKDIKEVSESHNYKLLMEAGLKPVSYISSGSTGSQALLVANDKGAQFLVRLSSGTFDYMSYQQIRNNEKQPPRANVGRDIESLIELSKTGSMKRDSVVYCVVPGNYIRIRNEPVDSQESLLKSRDEIAEHYATNQEIKVLTVREYAKHFEEQICASLLPIVAESKLAKQFSVTSGNISLTLETDKWNKERFELIVEMLDIKTENGTFHCTLGVPVKYDGASYDELICKLRTALTRTVNKEEFVPVSQNEILKMGAHNTSEKDLSRLAIGNSDFLIPSQSTRFSVAKEVGTHDEKVIFLVYERGGKEKNVSFALDDVSEKMSMTGFIKMMKDDIERKLLAQIALETGAKLNF